MATCRSEHAAGLVLRFTAPKARLLRLPGAIQRRLMETKNEIGPQQPGLAEVPSISDNMTSLQVKMTSILDISRAMAKIKNEEDTMRKFRLCNRLKVARAEKNLSQEQLGLLAGVTRQTISSIETGL